MTGSARRKAVETAIFTMRVRLAEDLALHDLARSACMSSSHFCHTFHAMTGIAPCQYLAALRLCEATRLLLTTDLSVTEVCFSVGYSSFGTFVRRYSLLAGVSPRRLRRLATRAASAIHQLPALSAGASTDAPDRCAVEVLAPEGFEGSVLVAAFPSPIPQGRPKSRAALARSDRVVLAGPLSSTDWVFAAGFRRGDDPVRCLIEGTWLRGAARCRPGAAIALRPAETIDPPMVFAAPIVAAEWVSEEGGHEAGRGLALAARAASIRSTTSCKVRTAPKRSCSSTTPKRSSR